MRPSEPLTKWLVAVLVFVGLAVCRPAHAQSKTARGTATTVTDVSLTVRVGDTNMTFDVDSKTAVEAPGAGRQTRAAQAAGASGIKLTSAIQSGHAVIVTYREANGKNVATDIRRVSDAGRGGGATSEPAQTATGAVKSVTGRSLVLTSQGKDSTFVIDQNTKVIGRGAGTAAGAAGGRLPITDLVGAGDSVSVSYKAMGGAMHATDVRVTAKAR
jgi:hypothetical protein